MRAIAKKIKVDAEMIFKFTALSSEGMFNSKYGTRDLGSYQGSCLPKDTQAFLQWVKSNGFKAPLLASTIKLNNNLMKDDDSDTGQIELEL